MIGEDFFKMISAIVKGGDLPKGVNKGLISCYSKLRKKKIMAIGGQSLS
jgi:hypothetical protein